MKNGMNVLIQRAFNDEDFGLSDVGWVNAVVLTDLQRNARFLG
jgi:hypothetical protein